MSTTEDRFSSLGEAPRTAAELSALIDRLRALSDSDAKLLSLLEQALSG